MAGPQYRQKLQPRGIEAIVNSAKNRQNTNQRRWEGSGGEGPYPILNAPNPWERNHSLDYMSPGWLEASAPRDNTGIMSAAVADASPDFQGNWLMNSPWGNRLLGLLSSRHGEEGTSEQLIDMIGGGGGIDLWGGKLKPTWEDDRYGLNWEIGFGG